MRCTDLNLDCVYTHEGLKLDTRCTLCMTEGKVCVGQWYIQIFTMLGFHRVHFFHLTFLISLFPAILLYCNRGGGNTVNAKT